MFSLCANLKPSPASSRPSIATAWRIRLTFPGVRVCVSIIPPGFCAIYSQARERHAPDFLFYDPELLWPPNHL